MRSSSKAWLVLCLSGGVGCAVGGGEPEQRREVRSSVIYGDDDRKEPLDYPVGSLPYTWAQSTAMMVVRPEVPSAGYGEITLAVTETFSESMKASGKPLCPKEPFQDQPILGGLCSAFLVAPDLVITAGHCVSPPGVCPCIAFVFGAGQDRPGRDPSQVGPDDVYACRDVPELVASGIHGDYAVVRIDRPVVDRAPLPLRRAGKVEDDEELILIGNPLGLPTKITMHGEVLDNSPSTSFKTNSDSYSGGSGSVVMGAHSGLVEGVLVRGETDFVQTGDCWVSRVCPARGEPCRGESVSRATEFAAYVPEEAALP